MPSLTPSVKPVNVTVRYIDPDTSDDEMVALSIRAFETCTTDKESVTMYRDGSYSVIATMTAESSTEFATALSAVVVAGGGDGLCGLTNATSTLLSWVGVKDDLSVVGFFLWLPRHTSDSKCSRHVDMPCHFDRGFVRCGVCSWIPMDCEWRCRVFNNRHFCSFYELTVLRTSRGEWKLFLPSSCDFS